ncbi:MAG: DDE-type integrase/transposase/recombinase [Candidatus Omnitrophota bacterium]
MSEIDFQKSDLPRISGYLAATNYLEDIRNEKEAKRKVKELGLAKFAQLCEARKREAEARFQILANLTTFIKASGLKKGKAISIFRDLYTQGKIDFPDWVFEFAGRDKKLDRSTLYRWEKAYQERGLFGLACSYGHKKRVTKLQDEQKDFIKAMIADHPDVLIPKIMAALEARFIPLEIAVPASHVIGHFVKRYRRENHSLLLYIKNPDAWRSNCQFAVGNASENITRRNQLWEADATPADIMLSDGRHAVVANIDVFSRAAKLLIVPTSKAQAIGTLLRRCIIDWGVPEILRTDLGKDFVSYHLERVLAALEIEQDLCPPFTPEAKPHIERFLHTFSHGIVELLPTFLGHSVAERKAIEARKSFAERLVKKSEIIEVNLTAREFQKICDRWITAVYMQNPHSSLGGKTPEEMVRSWTELPRKIEDERALDVLLCPAAKDGGWRVIGKKGVGVERRFYFNTAMAGYEGRRVQVLLDHSDLGKVYVFEESGAFLCVATCPDWYGISAQDEACYLKHEQKKVIVQKRNELKQLAKELRINTVPEEILSYRESLIENIKGMPRKAEAYTTPAIEEAILAADQRDGVVNKKALSGKLELPPEVITYERAQEKVVNLQAKRNERRTFENDKEIYFWILDCIKAGNVTEIQMQRKKEYEAWQDGGMKRPFCSEISISSLIGEAESSVEGL